MNGYIMKFLLVFALLMLTTFGLTFGMLALINPNDPNSIYTGVGFFLITFLPLLFGSMWYLNRGLKGGSKKEKRLLESGQRAPATIIAIRDTGITINNIYPVVKLALKVTPQHDQPFESIVETLVSRVDLPSPGDVVQVAYDENKKSDIVLVRDKT